MRTHWHYSTRWILTAAFILSITTAAMAQPSTRLSNRADDLNDVNRIMREGDTSIPGRSFSPPLNGSGKQIDYTRIDRRVLQNLLTESVAESENLYRALQKDYQRFPGVRPFMSDLLSLRARAARVARDLRDGASLQQLHPELQQLDSDWRLLSHQMTQSRLLSATSRDRLERIDRLQRSLEKLFQMDPQIDRRAVMIELSSLVSSLRNLVEELQLDPGNSDRIYDIIREARKLTEEATRVQELAIDMRPYAEIVTEFKRFEAQWKSLIPQLRTLNNRYVDRVVRNAMLSNDRLHDLLWLEQKTSRENLKQIVDALSRDVDEFFNRVSLKLLLDFKNVNSILETADDFYGVVQNFKDCVERNEDEQTMLVCYQYVEEYGNIFIRDFSRLRSSAGRVVLKEIEDGIIALRNELNLSGNVSTIDTTVLLPTAASLENMADHLDYDIHQWLRRDPQPFRNEALAASAAFLKRAQRIHKLLGTRPTEAELRKETADLIEEWRAVYNYASRCNTEQRAHLKDLTQDISVAIYNLRAPLEM